MTAHDGFPHASPDSTFAALIDVSQNAERRWREARRTQEFLYLALQAAWEKQRDYLRDMGAIDRKHAVQFKGWLWWYREKNDDFEIVRRPVDADETGWPYEGYDVYRTATSS